MWQCIILMNANTAKINSLMFLFATTPKMKLYVLEYLKFIFLFIYITVFLQKFQFSIPGLNGDLCKIIWIKNKL